MPPRFVHARSPYLVPFNGRFRIRRAPTDPPRGLKANRANEEALAEAILEMRKLQARLLANDRRALLLVFQALDAAGKDGTIKAVMSGINPAGCEVHSFKRPSEDELDHDFLWRVHQRAPQRGRIGIFNRSHYEEVLVVRVHPEILETQRLPEQPPGRVLWRERYESIRDFERHLARNGTTIVKFFLHVSSGEQRKRFLERIDDPEAHWKFQAADVRERQHFDDYLSAYQDALNETSRPWAPWYAVPADDKDYMRRMVAAIIVETLRQMDLHYPTASREERLAMAAAKKALQAETAQRPAR
jgi:PPK2 family polyphosphate:nucleotide phosphotransferase